MRFKIGCLLSGFDPFPFSYIEIAFIYGSIAKKQDTANSDIDIMLISNKISYSDIYQHLEKIEHQLGRKVNPTCYLPSEWQSKIKNKNHFIQKMLDQEKIFLIGMEDELKKLGQSRKNK